MRIFSWGSTHTGLKRASNQDSIVSDDRLCFFAVADGVGGHSGGEVASQIAVTTTLSVVEEGLEESASLEEIIIKSYQCASENIFTEAKKNKQLQGMGTTLVSVLFQQNKIMIGNVGDSRCYLFKKPFLWQLTEDHSLLNEHIRLGHMSEEMALQKVARNVITRCVGFDRQVQVDLLEYQPEMNDIILLCSDGLSSLVSDQFISKIINENISQSESQLSTPENELKKIGENLINTALAHGGDDNVSVIVLNFR